MVRLCKIMEELNDSESEIFKKTLVEQSNFISNRLLTIRNKYLDDPLIIAPQQKENITKHLNNGIAANLVHTFFNYKTEKCSYCDCSVGENGIRQIERAHCNNYSRLDILSLAVDDFIDKLDSGETVTSGEILKRFIEKHECCPIYMLCNKCHHKYDHF